jgi:glycerol-3-phosphate dehydrogenase
MKALIRNIDALSVKDYDLAIIGGGIYGVCAAWDAVLRGLSVVIIDKGDFCHATSANHFKMVHGGIRYLQHADLVRIRESSRERSSLLRIAPHLVKPLPIVIPTYGYGMKGKIALWAGMLLYDMLTYDRNSSLQKERQIPRGRLVSKKKVLAMFPGIKTEGLTGAAVFFDGQIYNPPRLVLSFLRSAVDRGAVAANYVEAVGFIKNGSNISGVQAKDVISGRAIEIRSRCVLNTCGPWAHHLLESALGLQLDPTPVFSRDLAFVVNREVPNGHAIAFSTVSQDADAVVDLGGRRLFAVSWRNYMLVGVWHKVFHGSPERITVSRQEIQGFVDEVNTAFPGLKIGMDEVTVVNTGLTLFGEEARQGSESLSFGKRSLLIDHERQHGFKGLVSLIGVRATTARGMAQKAITLIAKKLGAERSPSRTDSFPIYGGNFKSFNDLRQSALRQHKMLLKPDQIYSLVHNYGSEYAAVLKLIDENLRWKEAVGDSNTTRAEIVHAVRYEMACQLADVVFRRTDIGTGQLPSRDTLMECSELMAMELGWDRQRIDSEMSSVTNELHTVIENPN